MSQRLGTQGLLQPFAYGVADRSARFRLNRDRRPLQATLPILHDLQDRLFGATVGEALSYRNALHASPLAKYPEVQALSSIFGMARGVSWWSASHLSPLPT